MQVNLSRAWFQGGLSKLSEAQETVDVLSTEAVAKEAELKVKQAEADEALQFITVAMEKASDRKQEVAILKKEVEAKVYNRPCAQQYVCKSQSCMVISVRLIVHAPVQAGEISTRKTDVEAELAEVQPLIDAAKQAVGGIKQSNIDELRFLKAPPPAVRDVLQGVLAIMGIFDASWNSMKSFLSKRGVMRASNMYICRYISVMHGTQVSAG